MSGYEEIRDALSCVPPYPRERWLKIGMAVKSELGDDGFDLFDEWSQNDTTYNERDAKAVWRSFRSNGVTIKSLFGEARDNGWKPKNGYTNGHAPDPQAPAAREQRRRDEEARTAERQQLAQARARSIWESSPPAAGEHPYLKRKGIRDPHGARLYSGGLCINGMPCDAALVVPARDSSGALNSLQFISADKPDKRYLPDGRMSGCYFAIGKASHVLVIAEGFATGASIHEVCGHGTAVAFSAGNLLPVAKALRAKRPDIRIVIAADNDIKKTGINTGIEKAYEAARAVGGFVAVPELNGEKCDFNDLMLASGPDAVRALIDSACEPPSEPKKEQDGYARNVRADDIWLDPQPLTSALPPVQPFNPALLPDSLRDWVMDVSDRTQGPPEYCAIAAMTALGAALGRRLAVRPKRHDDWHEFGNLWAVAVGPPSWMKSPLLDEGKRALSKLETEMLKSYEHSHLEWEADFEAAKVTRDGAKDRARRAARDNKSFDKMELVATEIPAEPAPPRLIVNDASVAALCDVLRANPNGVLIYRDEISGLIAELDREGMEGAKGFYLSGWSGKEGHTQDRIARGTNLRVPHVCLSLLGGIQPSRIAPLLRESMATGGGDGFLARFSLTVWPDCPGEYRAIDRVPDEEARNDAWAVFRSIHTLDPSNVGAEFEDGAAPFLRLEPEAAERFSEWDVELRNRLRFGGEDGSLVAHLGKYQKAVCALALLSHLADGGTGAISVSAVLRALAWSEFLESHARRLYGSLGQSYVEAGASLLRHIRSGDLGSPFTLREVYRRGWAHLADPESARGAADVLESRHYLRSSTAAPGESGGRPSVVYHISPAVKS